MTCKDCVHVEVCGTFSLLSEAFEIASPERIASDCKNFKDRSRFVELPCKVGDVVYCLTKPSKRRITKISITVYGLRLSVNDMFCFDESQIGKTVFLTKEEAEQALKEREIND